MADLVAVVWQKGSNPLHVEQRGTLRFILDHALGKTAEQVGEEDLRAERVCVADVKERKSRVGLVEVVQELARAEIRLAFRCDNQNVLAQTRLFQLREPGHLN